ncbi:hypothetical protein ACFW9F_19515 [Streptomyces sp. NPDC059506]|uniref:hypothetical protein n=1 Tax=Streptomyces TaxID=1883 RepID=UPI0015F7C46F|nr:MULTISPECIES: hypothetical protein [unclassified Streptomyces]MCZ2526089.1 hypothetical protein [Streptomyces sp. HB2AG]QMV23975.1 hypothetical protein GQS52_21760 [Streptomyces sp. SCUT-3]
MKIDWAALGTVAGVSLVVTIALVGMFTLGISALSAATAAGRNGTSRLPARLGAYAAFAACTAGVGFGIYLIAS